MKITEKWVKPKKLVRLLIFFYENILNILLKNTSYNLVNPIGDLEPVLSLYYTCKFRLS